MRVAASLICALSVFSAAAIAQTAAAPSPIQTQFKAFKVHFVGQGKEELEPASNVSPGDVVSYVAVHRNVSAKRLLNIDFSIPIPQGTTLWQGSVQPAHGVLQAAAEPSQISGSKPSVQDRPRVVWRIERLNPGQSVQLSLRVSIDPDPSLGPAPAPNPFRAVQPQLRRP